jgi:hypothetical protein
MFEPVLPCERGRKAGGPNRGEHRSGPSEDSGPVSGNIRRDRERAQTGIVLHVQQPPDVAVIAWVASAVAAVVGAPGGAGISALPSAGVAIMPRSPAAIASRIEAVDGFAKYRICDFQIRDAIRTRPGLRRRHRALPSRRRGLRDSRIWQAACSPPDAPSAKVGLDGWC